VKERLTSCSEDKEVSLGMKKLISLFCILSAGAIAALILWIFELSTKFAQNGQ